MHSPNICKLNFREIFFFSSLSTSSTNFQYGGNSLRQSGLLNGKFEFYCIFEDGLNRDLILCQKGTEVNLIPYLNSVDMGGIGE